MKHLLFLFISLFSLYGFSEVQTIQEKNTKLPPDYYFTSSEVVKKAHVANQSNTSAAAQSNSVDFSGGFPQNAVIEEATGTWCGYCPRGIVMMDYIRENYSDRLFPIAVHQDDKMEIEGYSQFFSDFVQAFPSAFVNRNEEMEISTAWADQLYNQIKDQMTYARVEVSARIENNMLYIDSETEFAADIDSEHRLAFVVVEDSVGPFIQANYYNGSDLGLGSWDTAGNQVVCYFNDVARNIKYYDGIEGSLPDAIMSGVKYGYSTTIELTNVGSPACRVIGMIIDCQSNNIVNACQFSVNTSEGVYIDKGILYMTIGEKDILTAYLNGSPLDEKSCKWSSSDENVATVDNYGNIEAIGMGSAVITVTTDSGEAQCQVYVDLIGSIYEIEGIRYKITGSNTCMVAFPKEGERYMMEKIVIPSEIEVLERSFEVTELEFSMLTFTGAFYNSPNLIEIELPNTITYIPGDAFEGCYKLKKFKVPSSVWFIDAYAFYGCRELSDLQLNEGLTGLWSWSCAWCDSLKNIELPFTLESMGREVFYGTHPYWIHSKALEPPTLQGDLFNDEYLTDDYKECALVVPESCINAYKESEFWNRFEMIVSDDLILSRYKIKMDPGDEYKLDVVNSDEMPVTWSCGNPAVATVDAEGRIKALSIGKTIITAECNGKTASCKVIVSLEGLNVKSGDLWYEIKGNYECSVIGDLNSDNQPYGLETVTIPSEIEVEGLRYDVTEISAGAFYWCSSLKEITFSNTIRNINEYVFYNCTGLSKIVFNEGLKTLGRWALAECSELDSIVLPSTLRSIGLEVFAGVSPSRIVCKASTPPELDNDLFDVSGISSAYSECVLIVPAKSLQAYKEAEYWNRFENIEGDPSIIVETIEVTDISLDKSELNLTKGDVATLTATVLPDNATDKTVTWSSDNDGVATVDSEGTVTAISIGEATITASSGNYSASCNITVVATMVESIYLSPDSWSGIEGDSFRIEATVLPEEATDKTLIWTSSDESVATVDAEGNVTVLKAGTCVITASAADGSNVSAECIITSVAGVDGIFSADEHIDVFNLNGILIKKNIDKEEMNKLTPGIYVIRQGNDRKKVIIR